MAVSPRSFVLRHTRLRPVPGLEEIRLHLADEVLPLWHAAQVETKDPDAPMPYWAFAWSGGLAIGRYLREHPEVVAGRRVFDFASGSGLCALAALRAGATIATAADIDRFSAAAIELNARANRQKIAVVLGDVLDDDPPEADIVLAGDCWYDAQPGRPGPAVAPARPRPRDRGARRRSWPALLPGGRARRPGHVRRPNHDRARGPRAQAGARLHVPIHPDAVPVVGRRRCAGLPATGRNRLANGRHNLAGKPIDLVRRRLRGPEHEAVDAEVGGPFGQGLDPSARRSVERLVASPGRR